MSLLCCLSIFWLFQTHSQLFSDFIPLHVCFFFFYVAGFVPVCLCCIVLLVNEPVVWGDITCQSLNNTAARPQERWRKRGRHKLYKRIHLYLCIGVCVSARACSLPMWCLFTSEMEMIFIQFADDWLILYLCLFNLLEKQTSTRIHTFVHWNALDKKYLSIT